MSASGSADVAAPPAGGPSISTHSAALGDSIQVGTPRWYKVYYRDPDTSFCPEPPGLTFNVSNAVEISWAL